MTKAKTPTPDKAALARFQTAFAKKHGTDTIIVPKPPEIVTSGSLLLDHRLGCGGIPVGRIVHSWGPESVGKTTMAMIYAAQFQRRFPDKLVAWLDMEQTYLPSWAEAHGVDPERLILTQPQTAEEIADQTKDLMESDLFSMVVLDSVGGMIAKMEFEKDAEEATVAAVAKIVTRAIKIASVRGNRHQVTLHVINQVRAHIGGYGRDTGFGGGFALKHMNTISIEHKRTGETPLTDGTGEAKEVVGQTFNLFIEKNKLAPSRRSAMVTLLNQPTAKYGPVGIDNAAEAVELAKLTHQFARRGSWYDLSDGTSHNGEDAVRAHLRAHPGAVEEIRVRALAGVAHTVITDPMKEATA
jgi:recombination protein RecA